MRTLRLRRDSTFCRVVTGLLAFGFAANVLANPTGLSIGRGTATAAQSGSQLTVTASQNAILNWNTFNIAAGETTKFVQPSSTSIVWNRVNDPNPSQIFGTIQANGVVVLLNSSGFYFGPNSFVSAAGLVVSTANCAPPENGGGTWEFNGPPPLASIINYGHIQVGNGGSAFLIADQVENHGTMEAPGGSLGLAAGQTILLSERPDGRGMSLQVKLPQGSVDNVGNLIADAGTISLNAKVVNQNGLVQANSVQNNNGVIELVASDSLTLGAGSQILAQGDASATGSSGGTVTLQSGNNFSDTAGSQIVVTGGALGGHGGSIEVSAPNVLSLNSSLTAGAQTGSTAGQLLLNSQDITLTTSGANGMNGGTLDLNVNGTFATFAQIVLQASGNTTTGSGNITLGSGNVWDLGVGSGQLTLEAAGNISLGNGSKITSANNWSVALNAGYNFANNAVQSGQGNIYLGTGQSGNGTIQTTQSAIKLTAGNSINVGSGSQLMSAGGLIGLYAPLINQSGLIQANSIGSQHGIIELIAASSLSLGASSKIFANGDDAAAGSAGGQIMLQTPQTFSDILGSQIQFRGGANGGNGGRVLVYAASASVKSQLDGTAKTGFTAGSKFYYSRADTSDLTLTASSLAPFAGFSSILFQRSGNIILDAASTLDLGAGTGQLTLAASGDITFKSTTTSSAKIFDAGNWSVTLDAGYNFANNTVKFGTGNIFLNGGNGLTGGGLIQTASGSVSLTAGQSIIAGKGYVNTTGGGSITAQALKGNVDFSKGLGGISTTAGGDVSLMAYGNVLSFLPVNGKSLVGPTAGSGAYGAQPGDVTVVAGGNVTGQYMVANGIGTIYAGVQMDAITGNPKKDSAGNYLLGTTGSAGSNPSGPNLALELIKGGWNVTAALNIILQEVRNPNGLYGANHTFDYAPDAFVNLTAGNMVQLGGSKDALPRSLGMPIIYAPILNISAGSGGVHFYGDSTYNQLILFPSPEGGLTINTSGSLVSDLTSVNNTPQIFKLIVSDSGKNQYTTSGDFGLDDHALTPVHLGNPTPIMLNISGDMSLVLLGAPEAAQINIGGNMLNSRFQGMNLAAGDTTSLNVTGQILDRSAFTSVNLNGVEYAAPPTLAYLSQSLISNPTTAQLVASFYYDSATGFLTYQNITGLSLANVLALVQNLPIQVYKNGIPQWQDAEQTIPLTESVSIFNDATDHAGATAAALQIQYNADNAASGLPAGVGPPSSATGLIMGGGGKFDITAQSIELGTSAGIVSKGAGLYRIGDSYPLASLFDKGSDIFVTTTGHPTLADPAAGDISMFSSSIASLNGGLITVSASENINLGSSQFTPNSNSPRGIYSTSGSDVTVYAGKDINLNGSRIATYDGGNVTVESFNGSINAGVGGVGGVLLTAYYVDPLTHTLYLNSPVAFGSGIIAETFGPRDSGYPAPAAALGNVLVETPNGSVNANQAGVLQLAFNHVDYPNATVEVLAGYELRDSSGHRLTAAQIGGGTPVPVFSSQNVVSLGTPIQVTPSGSTTPISLTPVLDVKGQPVLAANGQPLYIQTADPKQQIVEFAGQVIQPYLDSGGNNVSVAEPLDANKQPYLDGSGNPILVLGRNVDASNSGVIAQNAILQATGDVKGAIFAKGNIDVAAVNNVNVTALAQGTASVNAGGTLSGTIIGIGGISASGSSVDAALLSNAGISGATSGQTGFAQGTAANATAQADQSPDAAKAAETGTGDDPEEQNKKKKGITLAAKVSRVTVLLPTKNN